MRLKSLEMQGYKSFANKVVVQFDHQKSDITAIVGPNGSGKSNVSDAIRWVLGEQSYSSLRGHRTADMIFSGSSNRASMGMAYATIVLDNSDGSLPLDYNEVTISRRAFRSGENEYLINNNRVRLRDVTELLSRGGLARQTYTVIGQGTIDRALSLKAEERRQLFEEAAGIVYHRQRRAETMRRMNDTHSNLLRLNDILSEIEPRLRRLEKQLEKVEEHQKIRTHLDGLLKVLYGYRWAQGQDQLHRARVRHTINTEQSTEQQTLLQQLEERIQHLRQTQTELRAQLGDWHAESSRLHTQAEAIQRELAVGEERARQLAAQREEFLGEITVHEETLHQHETELRELQSQLQETEQTQQQAQQQLNDIEARLKTRQSERQQRLQTLRQLEHTTQQCDRRLADVHSRLSQLAERNETLRQQQSEQDAAITDLEQEQQTQRQSIAAGETEQERLQQQQTALETEQASLTEEQETLQQQAREFQKEVSRLEKAQASVQARQDVLARLRQDMAGYFDGVRNVLQADRKLRGVIGTVSQLLQVPAHLEQAIETALGGRLQDVVVDRWDNADAAIQYLKQTKGGRATFLPLDRVRRPGALKQPSQSGMIGLAIDLVSYPAEIQAVAEHLLNRVLVVEDLPAAQRAFDSLDGSFQLVTLGGELVRSGGAISGGQSKQGSSQGGILAREREWRELPQQLDRLQTDLKTQHAHLATNAEAQQNVSRQLAGLQARQGTLQEASRQQQDTINRLRNRLSDLSNQIDWRHNLKQQAEQEIETNQRHASELQTQVSKLNAEKDAATTQITALQADIEAFSIESLLAERNQAQTEVSVIAGQRKHQQQLWQTVKQARDRSQSQLDSRRGRSQALAEQRVQLVQELNSKQESHQALLAELAIYTTQIEPAETELKTLETEQSQLETEESRERATLRRLEGEQNRSAVELTRRQDELQALQRQIEDDFGLVQLDLSADQIGQPALPIHPIVTQLPRIETLPEGLEEDVRLLKVRLRQLGHVNLDAPREHEEVQDRYTFLRAQMEDLEDAARDLREVITELDKIMEESFRETFDQVATEFQNYFRLLFNGGEARLDLTDPENLTETGVEIIARPPGKRLQSLELLSGGERSLTAQALVFALLRTSPTPYCVFDEVDAMLDEANVDRFAEAVRALSHDIQFIIITHNRKTIEIAGTIYGVSMGDDAVSRVVSLKLEDLPNQTGEQLGLPV